MNSTTTCSFSNAWITRNTGSGGNPSSIQLPTANNQNFEWGSSTCVTVSDPQGIVLQNDDSNLSGDGIAFVIFASIIIAIAILFYWKGRFDIFRYD